MRYILVVVHSVCAENSIDIARPAQVDGSVGDAPWALTPRVAIGTHNVTRAFAGVRSCHSKTHGGHLPQTLLVVL